MIRVITGTAKGRKLIMPQHGTRPLTDRIKTSIFDLILEFISDANVLDLYAGSGSFGIEALSRGAKSATFVDLSDEAIDCISTNLLTTQFNTSTQVIQDQVNNFITTTIEMYDLIFLDPPFDTKLDPDFSGINKILQPDGLLVYRTLQNRPLPRLPEDLLVVYQKIYGKSKVIFFRKESKL
jgi:16S rRNA (guanine966-N2)-methyltransferase